VNDGAVSDAWTSLKLRHQVSINAPKIVTLNDLLTPKQHPVNWRIKTQEKLGQATAEVVQNELSIAKPYLKLVLVLPVTQDEFIQDEILLRSVVDLTFAAPGILR
jgi:hypothetical protein